MGRRCEMQQKHKSLMIEEELTQLTDQVAQEVLGIAARYGSDYSICMTLLKSMIGQKILEEDIWND